MILSSDGVLPNPLPAPKTQDVSFCPFPTTLNEVKRTAILHALEERGWVIGGPAGAAAKLGLKRSTVTFTEDKGGFYINGRKFGMADPPTTTVATGSYRHWRVVNNTREVHPFHIHQVHFLTYSRNDQRLAQPEWLDTVDVPVNGSVDLIMDFTDPVIRWVSLFHCHLSSHEDKGMMAKIRFK
ncbi:MAG: multicopper oxidase domain-containing protein [Terracidiphilus sp.]